MSDVTNHSDGGGTSRVTHTKACLGAAAQAAVKVAHKAAKFIPTGTKRGFGDGYEAVNGLVEHIPYATGAVAGFCYGTAELVVDAIAVPAMMLVGLGAWVGGMFYSADAVAEDNDGVTADLPVASAQ